MKTKKKMKTINKFRKKINKIQKLKNSKINNNCKIKTKI